MIFMNEKVVSGFTLLPIFLEMGEKRIFEASYKNNESLKKEDNSFSLVW